MALQISRYVFALLSIVFSFEIFMSPLQAAPYDFNEQWKALQRSEQVLEDQMRVIQERGFTARDIMELASVHNQDYTTEADFFQRTFQAKLDDHIQMQFDFFIEGSFAAVKGIKEILFEKASDREKARLELKFSKVEENYNDYQLNKVEYGRPKDWLRTRSIRNFFQSTRDFMQTFQTVEYRLFRTGLTRTGRLRGLVSNAVRYTRIAVEAAPSALSAVLELILNRRPREDFSPFVEAVMGVFRSFAQADGFSVDLAGRHHIPRRRIPGEVNIIVPTHRDEIYDQFITSAMGISDMIVFGASGHFAGEMVTRRLDQSHSFIVVGGGANRPIDKAIAKIKEGVSNNILIYPEGNVPGGFGETRPPREKFVKGLVMGLRAEGYKVKLIPITNINAARFLGRYNIPEQKQQRAIVHPPISERTFEGLLATGDEQAINRLIRAVWLETMITNEHTIVGQMRAQTSLDALSNFLFEGSEIAKDFIRTHFGNCEHMLSL